jgi:hypothetical protein
VAGRLIIEGVEIGSQLETATAPMEPPKKTVGALLGSSYFLQLRDAVEQFQSQGCSRQIDSQIALQVNGGSYPPHAADVEVPLICAVRVWPVTMRIKNTLCYHGNDLISLHGTVVAKFFQGDE